MDARVKEVIEFCDDYKHASNAATGAKYDPNANVTCQNLCTMQAEAVKKLGIDVQRAIALHYITQDYGEELANQYVDDLKKHIIYVHDESNIAGYPYCCSISLYPFLLNGLKDLGGSSLPPKHANSYIGGLINLVFLISAQFAGALALPEALVYLDYFLRKDYGQDYTKHLDEEVNTKSHETIRHIIEDLFQQFVYSINQPAGSRNYQSPFINIAYYDKGYFQAIFKDFVFPDGDEPCWQTTKVLQKMFMKWFNKERTKSILTFPVETANALYSKETKQYKDPEFADLLAEMWAEGHSFFCYNSDSADALSSCCFSGDTMTLSKSSKGVNYLSFKDLYHSNWRKTKRNFTVFHNGSWVKGKVIKLPNRPMYKITLTNNKEMVISDNHLNVTLRGDIETTDLKIGDYLLFNNRSLEAIKEQDLHLSYEEGFVIGAFLGDGSFSNIHYNDKQEVIDATINFSLNQKKYQKFGHILNQANHQLGNSSDIRLGKIYNNVYPITLKSAEMVNFIIKWTKWKQGTYAFNKQLNLDCLLQSKEFRQGILDGWYATDGGNSNRCYSTSKQLIDNMEVLMTSLGLISIIDISDRIDEETYIRGQLIHHNYPLYCIRWYQMGNRRGLKDVYVIRNNSVYFKIKSIEQINYSDDIYCFEMSNPEEPYFTLPNGIITHNCRLKNAIEDNTFSYTLGAGGIQTGSKRVITMNLNRIIQDWSHETEYRPLSEKIKEITSRMHKYLKAWNHKLWDDYNAGMLPVYKAGFIDLDKQFLTIGVNGFIEAAEYLKMSGNKDYIDIEIDPDNIKYKQLAKDILLTIKDLNIKDREEHVKFNTEFVPSLSNVGTLNYL